MSTAAYWAGRIQGVVRAAEADGQEVWVNDEDAHIEIRIGTIDDAPDEGVVVLEWRA